MPRGANFSREELDSFLDSVEDILPLSTTQWESVVETHMARYPDKGRTVDSLKRNFKELHIKRIPVRLRTGTNGERNVRRDAKNSIFKSRCSVSRCKINRT